MGEGVPRILLEAAASGLAIVANDVPGCRDIVTHGINGLLVQPRDTVALAQRDRAPATDPEERARFGRAGRDAAIAEFDERIVIRNTMAVYRELLPPQAMPMEECDASAPCV